MEQATYIPEMNGNNEGTASRSEILNPQSFKSGSTMIDGLPYGNPYSQDSAKSTKMFKETVTTPKTIEGTPVVGFLYSVSKNGFPEYWPLYVGRNSVGKGSNVDICLREASVSDHHADIQIKKMRQQGGRLIATIVDAGSKNGIILNEEELDYDRHALKNGDIITIGLNYKFVFILVDPVELDLRVEEKFVPLEPIETAHSIKAVDESPVIPDSGTTHHPSEQGPYSNPYDGYRTQDETVNISGPSYDGLNAGGTKIL